MTRATLTISSKNYSSWSLRGWLLARFAGLEFVEQMLPPDDPGVRAEILLLAPSILVPCLTHQGVRVWDTLAIAEYLAERHSGMWPADAKARSWGRSITCEMHSGFGSMRNDMTMCIRERIDVRPWSPATTQNIQRVTQIWTESRSRFGTGGDFLCGAFSIADCFYAPVAYRFQTYGVTPENDAARTYLRHLLAHPLLQAWEKAALAETMVIEADEPRVVYRDKLAAAGRL